MQLVRKQKFIEENNNSTEPATLPLELEILKHQMKLTAKDMEPFFDKEVYGFWLPKSVSNYFLEVQKVLICTLLYPLSQGLPGFFINKKVAELQADRAVYESTKELISSRKLEASFVKISKPPTRFKTSTFMLSERQSKWILDAKSKSLVEGTNDDQNKSPVKLFILKPKEKKSDVVIYHIHGGGWILGSPGLYFSILDEIVDKVGATIVSIDYSLSPENKYPVAAQEILDTYFWLAEASAQNKTLEPLGISPKEIVVTGDSASGNLTIVLAILLAEIEKKSPGSVKFPKALNPLYPAASPTMPYNCASTTMLDIILLNTIRMKYSFNYYPGIKTDENISYLKGKNDPWFKDDVKLTNVYKEMNENRKTDPIFHITSYDSFDVLKHVPLYVQGAEFDPLLDEAIKIAKIWKGPVTLDVVPDLCHAFPHFMEKSSECKKAYPLIIQRMKEAVEN